MVANLGAHFACSFRPALIMQKSIVMAGDSTNKIDNERLRIHHAFWLSLFGLTLAAALAVFLIVRSKEGMVDESSEVVAIVGLFTSVTGTLVGAFFGLQIGAAGAERERRSRETAEASRQKAEERTRIALAQMDPGKAEQFLKASHDPPVS
jgi:hypothetical protein